MWSVTLGQRTWSFASMQTPNDCVCVIEDDGVGFDVGVDSTYRALRPHRNA